MIIIDDVLAGEAWMARGACRDADPNLFVPGDAFDGYDPEYPSREAKNICDRCPVFAECDAWATTNEPYGVWAGKTHYQRKQLRRRIRRVSCPSCTSRDVVTLDGIETCMACGQSWRLAEHGTT